MQHLSRRATHAGAVDAMIIVPVCTSLGTTAGSYGPGCDIPPLSRDGQS
jgi:hypothetical protein